MSTAVSAGRLLGRRGECAALDELVASLRAGESRALVLRGDAGIGKSALLVYLAEHSSGCGVARAAGVESEMELAYAGLQQLCAPFLDRLERLPGPQRDALGTAFGLRGGGAPDRFLVGLAVLSLLSDVAEDRPLVCIVDDAQWLGVASSWSIAGLFLSLGPELTANLFHTTNHLIASVGVFALAGSGAAATLAFGRTQPWLGAAGGSLALAAGMGLLVIATASNSAALFLAGAILGGGGFGVAFLGALRALTAVIPNQQRAAVMSAFYVVAYAALSLPAIAGGTVVSSLGILTTFEVFGTIVSAVALVAAGLAWRTRPRTYPAHHRFAPGAHEARG